ncbi:MAG: NTP transferase domain-containing protein [Clostridia bacterium]|nr:NTP transferase domain-containing protein [Clostridia bacterium]
MKSDLPKVLMPVLGKPMLDYVTDACKKSVKDICVIVGFKADVVKQHLGDDYCTALQSPPLGTAHAVMQATDFIAAHKGGNVLVVCGDAPLMDGDTIKSALDLHTAEKNAVTVITAQLDDPASYGRIVKENGKISAIVEFKDANEEQAKIKEINSGAYWFDAEILLQLLDKIDNNNAQNEYYLTDTIKIAIAEGYNVNSYVAACPDVVMGANDPAQLQLLNERAKLYF